MKNRIIKKALSALLTVALILGALPAVALIANAAEPDFEYEDITGGVRITDCTNIDEIQELVIPSTIDGKKVLQIDYLTFYSCDSLVTVTLPNSLELIDENAFEDCTSVSSVSFGNVRSSKLAAICNEAFLNVGLRSAALPNALETIGDGAFKGCTSLASVSFGSSATASKLRAIGAHAFEKTYVTRVVLPDSLEVIGEDAFGDSSLVFVDVPFTEDEWASVGGWAYYGVDATNNAALFNASLTFLEAPAFTCEDVAGGVKITGCTNIDNLYKLFIPAEIGGKAVLEIGDFAFYGCSGIKSLVLPDSLVSIGDRAFYNCSAIASVTFGSGLKTIGECAFFSCSALRAAAFPDSLESIGSNAFDSCNSLASVSVPFLETEWTANGGWACYGVTNVNNAVLYNAALTFLQPPAVFTYEDVTGGVKITGCSNIDKIFDLVIPAELDGKAVLEIGYEAFKECTGIRSIVFPDSLETIGEWAFAYCSSLASITFGSGLKTLNADAFLMCTSLTAAALPDSLETIGYLAFYNCSALKRVTFGSSQTASKLKLIDQSAFAFSGITAAILPDSLETLSDDAFTGCSELKTVVFCSDPTASKLNKIKGSTFQNTAINSLVLPDSIESIGEHAFYGCGSLASVTFGSGLKTIGNSAFYNCSVLRAVAFPDSLDTIGNDAFAECDYLSSVTFGSSQTASKMKTVGEEAFYGCLSIYSISLPASLESIGAGAFEFTSVMYVSVPFTEADWTAAGGWAHYNVDDSNNEELYNARLTFLQPTPVFTCVDIDGGVKITECTNINYIEDLVIPAEIDGKAVLEIGSNAFWQKSIKSVTFPDSVVSIGANAFMYCRSLVSVTFGSGLKTIGNTAFDFTAITSLVFPDSLEEIGDGAFYNCASLASVTFGSGLKTIGDVAFFNTAVASLVFPDSLEEIGDSAFEKAPVTSVTFPDSLETIGQCAFSECASLASITFGSSPSAAKLKTIGEYAFDYCPVTSLVFPDTLESIGRAAFVYCTSLASVTFGSGLKTIGDVAFAVTALTSIALPDSLESIADDAFGDCALASASVPFSEAEWTANGGWTYYGTNATENPELYAAALKFLTPVFTYEEITGGVRITGCTNLSRFPDLVIPSEIDGKAVLEIGEQAFKQTGVTSVTLPDTLVSIGAGAFEDCNSLVSVTFPDSLETIGDKAFNDCDALASVTFGSGLKTIGEQAFTWCTSIASVTLPDSLETVGNEAFCDCDALASVTFGSGLKSIGDYAFSCDAITSLTLPDSLETIGESAFAYCPVASVTFGSGLKTIGEGAFYKCSALTGVTFPDSLETIGDEAFKYCPVASVTFGSGLKSIGEGAFYRAALTSVTFPDSLEVIGGFAFYSCASLSSVTFGSGLKTIGQQAFSWCASLTSVTLPDSLETVDIGVFIGCSSLASITFGSGLKTIGNSMFNNCTSLTSVTFPDEVEVIGDYAFYACPSLTSVTFGSGLKTIRQSAFDDCEALTSVTLPDSLETIGDYAFQWCNALETVTIGTGLKTIGDCAFRHCNALDTVYYDGSKPMWEAIDISDIGNDPLFAATLICKLAFTDSTAIAISGTERYGSTMTATVTDLPAAITDAVINWRNAAGDLLGTGATYVLTANEIGTTVYAELYSEMAGQTIKSDETGTIGKAIITGYKLPTAAAIMYPQTLAEATLTGGDVGGVEGVWTWDLPDEKPTSEQNGSLYALTFTPTGEYAALYEVINAKLAITVEPAPFEPKTVEDPATGLELEADFAQDVEVTLTDIPYSNNAYLALLRASKNDASGLGKLILMKTVAFTINGEPTDEAYTGTVTIRSYVGEKLAGNEYSVWFFIDGAPVSYVGTVDANGVLVIDGVEL